MSERAMMSDRRPGLRPDLYRADQTWLERTAHDEARRILAETEPDSGTGRLYLTAHKRHGYHSGLHGWPAGRDILAEALATFCALEQLQ